MSTTAITSTSTTKILVKQKTFPTKTQSFHNAFSSKKEVETDCSRRKDHLQSFWLQLELQSTLQLAATIRNRPEWINRTGEYSEEFESGLLHPRPYLYISSPHIHHPRHNLPAHLVFDVENPRRCYWNHNHATMEPITSLANTTFGFDHQSDCHFHSFFFKMGASCQLFPSFRTVNENRKDLLHSAASCLHHRTTLVAIGTPLYFSQLHIQVLCCCLQFFFHKLINIQLKNYWCIL